MFIVWITAITVLAVIPHSDDGIMVSGNLTTSGMEKQLIGYFIAALLFYYAYAKKEDRGRRSEIRGQRTEGEGLRKRACYILLSGFLIFLYSVALEILQFFLPYRTFNMDDIAANASGIFLFVVIWIIYFQVLKSKQEG